MKRFSLSIIPPIIAAVLSVACQPNSAISPGNSLTEEYPGKWIVINYWAEWCAPCIKEIPELNQFASEYKNSVAVFAVNFDGARGEQLTGQAKKLNIQFNILESDPSSQLAYPRPTVLPTTVFICPNGKIQSTLIGPQTLASLNAEISTCDQPPQQ